MEVVDQGHAGELRRQAGYQCGTHAVGMEEAEAALPNQSGQLQGRPQVEPAPHRQVVQRDRLALSQRGEAAGLEAHLGHVEA